MTEDLADGDSGLVELGVAARQASAGEVAGEERVLPEAQHLGEVARVFGALELGGTKTVVAVGDGAGNVMAEERFPTTSPEETLARAVAWLRTGGQSIVGLGVASFGPIRVNRDAPDFGTMLGTPKAQWRNFPVGGYLADAFPGVTLALDTDVNAAVLAEATLGAAIGVDDLVYITIGTGIGGGILSGGRLVHGLLHPEFGHLKTPRAPGDAFAGVCPYHGDCLEGMACGPAISERWGVPGHQLPDGHPAWEAEAWYLAHGILALLAIVSPARVIVGGGVSQAGGLHDHINRLLLELAGGYFPALLEDPPFVVEAGLGQEAGIRGALLLASGEWKANRR
jgi:fructokinase